MALCISKRPMTEEECEDICQRQADGLDELLSYKDTSFEKRLDCFRQNNAR